MSAPGPQQSDPAAELLALERAREARRERLMREVRHSVAACLIIALVIFVFLAWAASR